MNPFRGLKGWYAFEGNPDDSGPEKHAGVAVGMVYGVGKVGRCGVFDGLGARVETDNLLLPATKTLPFTIAAWVNPQDTGDYRTIASNTDMHNEFSYQFCLDNGAGTFGLYWDYTGEAWDGGLTTAATAPPNVWSYVAVTYAGNYPQVGMSLYLNGVSVPFAEDSGGVVGDVSGVYRATMIGTAFYWGTICQPFKGSIDELVFANRALSAQEIYQLYIGGTPME